VSKLYLGMRSGRRRGVLCAHHHNFPANRRNLAL